MGGSDPTADAALNPDSFVTARSRISYKGRPSVDFGAGTLNQLGGRLIELGIGRILIVVGQTIAGAPLISEVRKASEPCDTEVFAGVRAHNPHVVGLAGLEKLRSVEADALMALGGGSAIDAAKSIALLAAEQESPHRDSTGASDSAVLPIVAIPTTLSQSEYTDAVGITDIASRSKSISFNRDLLPVHVVLDSEIASTTPDRLWLGSALKALDTCGQFFLEWSQCQPFWDPVLLSAFARLLELLQRPIGQLSRDRELRGAMQLAAWMAAFPFAGLPVEESAPRSGWLSAALRHQLGAYLGAPHGELSGVLLPLGLEFHLSATETRQRVLASRLGYDHPTQLWKALSELPCHLGLPSRLRAFGMEHKDVDRVVNDCIRELPELSVRSREIGQLLTNVI